MEADSDPLSASGSSIEHYCDRIVRRRATVSPVAFSAAGTRPVSRGRMRYRARFSGTERRIRSGPDDFVCAHARQQGSWLSGVNAHVSNCHCALLCFTRVPGIHRHMNSIATHRVRPNVRRARESTVLGKFSAGRNRAVADSVGAGIARLRGRAREQLRKWAVCVPHRTVGHACEHLGFKCFSVTADTVTNLQGGDVRC
jgi:hypothetical protein